MCQTNSHCVRAVIHIAHAQRGKQPVTVQWYMHHATTQQTVYCMWYMQHSAVWQTTSYCNVIHIAHKPTAWIYQWSKRLKNPVQMSVCKWGGGAGGGINYDLLSSLILITVSKLIRHWSCFYKSGGQSGGSHWTPWGPLPPPWFWLVRSLTW